MAKVYFRRILAGGMAFSEVPAYWQVAVQELLIAAGRADLCGVTGE